MTIFKKNGAPELVGLVALARIAGTTPERIARLASSGIICADALLTPTAKNKHRPLFRSDKLASLVETIRHPSN
jgi:hypothetical protein